MNRIVQLVLAAFFVASAAAQNPVIAQFCDTRAQIAQVNACAADVCVSALDVTPCCLCAAAQWYDRQREREKEKGRASSRAIFIYVLVVFSVDEICEMTAAGRTQLAAVCRLCPSAPTASRAVPAPVTSSVRIPVVVTSVAVPVLSSSSASVVVPRVTPAATVRQPTIITPSVIVAPSPTVSVPKQVSTAGWRVITPSPAVPAGGASSDAAAAVAAPKGAVQAVAAAAAAFAAAAAGGLLMA
ncbi:hypothetical protein BDZ88DRAFT_415189 [Geranomyces variabilis]|nr:hypothetical protein BDZ88DRAFT_415189 [Geranomyces variabilis]